MRGNARRRSGPQRFRPARKPVLRAPQTGALLLAALATMGAVFQGYASGVPKPLPAAVAAPATRPAGSRVAFRVVPNGVGSSRQPVIPLFVGRTTERFWQRARKDLAANGPGLVACGDSGMRLRWMELKCGIPTAPLTGTYKGRRYVLLCEEPPYAMLPGAAGRKAWGLKDVYTTKDGAGRPAVGLRFDENGSRLFAALTKANVGNALAILVDGKVRSASVVVAPAPSQAIITVRFAAKEVRELVRSLRAGMTPVRKPATQPVAKWGRAVDGLRCRLSLEKATVPMGAGLTAAVHLRFDPDGVDAKLNVLNRAAAVRRVSLALRNTTTGKVYRRTEFDVGMPPSPPNARDVVRLRGGRLRPETVKVYLLSDKGEQVPPGAYQVTATYENTPNDRLVGAHVGPDGALWWRPRQERFWKGRVVSAPALLTITPAAPKEIELRTHSALVIEPAAGRIGWSWSTENPRKIRVRNRPGYVIARSHKMHVFLNGKEVEHTGGGMGGVWQEGAGVSYLPERIVRRVRAGEKLLLRAEVVIFETSVPVRHLWAPRAGDYKVLWQGRVEGSLPAR